MLHLPTVQCSVGASMPIQVPSASSRQSSIFIILLLVALTTTLSACSGGPWRDSYFKKGVGRLTQDDIRDTIGPPHTAKNPVLGGDSLWTYRVSLSDQDLTSWNPGFLIDASNSVGSLMGKGGGDASKPTLYCYRYLLTFSEEKILKTWKREECVPGTRENLTSQSK